MQDTIYQIEDNVPDTHCFVYKNKSYPFKLDFFKHSSKYFADHLSELEDKTDIPLIDAKNEDKDDLSEEGIKSFINYAQHQPIQITNDTVYTLSFLSKIYEIKSLQESTTKFIESHQKELIIDILLYSSTKNKDSYEDIMSNNLLEHIEDEKLLKLDLNSIYRILIKYESKRTKNPEEDDKEERDKIFTFLFKCLDKFGKNASALFSAVDFGSEKRKFLNKLLRDYSKSFDFNYIDSQMVQILYEEENDTLQKKFSQDEKIQKLEETVIQLKKELDEVKTANIQLQSELSQSVESNKSQQDAEISRIREEMNSLRDELNEFKNSNNQELAKQKRTFESELDSAINRVKDEIKNSADTKVDIQKFDEFKNSNNQELANQKQAFESELNSAINRVNDENKNSADSKVDIQKFNEFKNSIENDQQQQTKIDNNLKDDINKIRKLMFIDKNLKDTFNRIDGEHQILLLDFINFNDDSNKVLNLLKYLSNEKKNSNKSNDVFNYLFFPDVSDKDYMKNVGISSEMSEILYANNKLESNEFTSKIDLFTEFYIEIQYQSNNYNEFYQKLVNLRQSHGSLKIAVFIKGADDFGQKFRGNKDICFVRLDKSVTKISSEGFRECASLKHIIIPPSVTEIGDWCFWGCNSLTHITIPNSVTKLGCSSLRQCPLLEEVVFPSSITTIRGNILYNCKSLKRVVIPSSVTSIEACAFQSCYSLSQISIPPSVKKIGDCVFANCPSLSHITIPPSVTEIGSGVFRNCPSLKQVTIPSSLNSPKLEIPSNAHITTT